MPSCPADKWKLSEEREREEVDHLETLPTVYQKHSVISQNPITLIFTAVGFLAVFKFWWSVYEVQSVIHKPDSLTCKGSK